MHIFAILAALFLLAIAQMWRGPLARSLTIFITSTSLVGITGLLLPFTRPAIYYVLMAALGTASFVFFLMPREKLAQIGSSIVQTKFGRIATFLLISLIIPFGSIEWLASYGVAARFVDYFRPVHLTQAAGGEDVRMVTMVADNTVMPDAELMWIPQPKPPFNQLNMQGPIPIIPKPKGTFRILTYGDSNTEGFIKDVVPWPELVSQATNHFGKGSGLKFEVLNAGVRGYTSYQGLTRFRRQVRKLQPDLVIVAFGWNDATRSHLKPDADMTRMPEWATYALRTAVKYTSFLVLAHYIDKWRDKPISSGTTFTARVPLDDYLQNMETFLKIAKQHKAKIAFLTRVHKPLRQDYLSHQEWRYEVPKYNQALLEFGIKNEVKVVDTHELLRAIGPANFEDECHLTQKGHKILAQYLFVELTNAGYLPKPKVSG